MMCLMFRSLSACLFIGTSLVYATTVMAQPAPAAPEQAAPANPNQPVPQNVGPNGEPTQNFNAKAFFKNRIPVGNMPVSVQPLPNQPINSATLPARVPTHRFSPVVLRTQILLDRAFFSPGQIDGDFGDNTHKALAGYQFKMGLPVTGLIDPATWHSLLQNDAGAVLGRYTINQNDVAGPFVKHLPGDLDAQSNLPCTCYTSPIEKLGEKFHVNPHLLQKLNRGQSFDTVGTAIIVPIVHRQLPAGQAARVVVTKHTREVRLLDASGHILAQYPATIGSQHDPLPIGTWKIKGVSSWPKFHYNPKLFWDASDSDSKAVVPPGPNNPVGVVWNDLSKNHYGIHGTPDPALIGKTFSHGCIRLTNWDAWALSKMIHAGTPAILQN